jgi:putative membrane protein
VIEVAGIVAAAVAYRRGVVAMHALPAGRRTVPSWRIAAFVAGLLVVLVAVSPPVDGLAHQMLSAHMVQHVLLILVAAPLIAAGAPQLVVPRGLPGLAHRVAGPVRRRVSGVVPTTSVPRLLVAGTALHLLSLWVWHSPGLYGAALASPWLHALEHIMFLGSALLVWTALLRPGRRARLTNGFGVLCVWVLLVQGGILSALIVFAGEPLYGVYAAGGGAGLWGLDPVSDQQAAGLLMWLPGGVLYGIAGVATFLAWFRAVETRTRGRRHAGPPVDGDEVRPPRIIRPPDARPAADVGADPRGGRR